MCAFHEPYRFITRDRAEKETQPWGEHHWFCKPGLVDTGGLMVVEVAMPPGTGHRFHRHPTREEAIYIVSGQAEQWVDRKKLVLRGGEAAHIPPDIVHGIYNTSDDVCRFVAILAPPVGEGPFLIDVYDEEPWRSLRPAR